MSYNSELQANNTNLQDILDTINNLPESGGGGGNIETCTITYNLAGNVGYTTCSNSQLQSNYDTTGTYGRIINAVKGTLIYCSLGSYYAFTLTDGITIFAQTPNLTIFAVASDAPNTATIYGYYNDL